MWEFDEFPRIYVIELARTDGYLSTSEIVMRLELSLNILVVIVIFDLLDAIFFFENVECDR